MSKQRYKAIVYAYPSSPRAAGLGHGKTGCYYLEFRDGDGPGYVAPGSEGEACATLEQCLIDLYHEHADRQPCPMFLRYSNVAHRV